MESLSTTGRENGEQGPGYYFANAQYDLNLRILRLFEGGTLSLDTVQMVHYLKRKNICVSITRTTGNGQICRVNI